MNRKRSSAIVAALVAVAILVAFAACSKRDSPVAPVVAVPGIEDPEAAVERFRAAWVHRDTTALASTLDAFLAYSTACVDGDGDVFFGEALLSDSLLLAASRLFALGSAGYPAAASIDVDLGPMEVGPGFSDSVYERTVFCSPKVVVRTSTDTLHLSAPTAFDLWRVHGPYAGAADTTRWHLFTWVEVATAPARPPSLGLAGMRSALRAALVKSAAIRRYGPSPRESVSASAECDSLARTVWGYALLRYFEPGPSKLIAADAPRASRSSAEGR